MLHINMRALKKSLRSIPSIRNLYSEDIAEKYGNTKFYDNNTVGNIFRNLEKNDLQNAMRTCTFLRNAIVNDNSLWRAYSRKKLIISSPIYRQPTSQYWYHQCRLSHNWCNGIYRDKIIIQHRTSYMPWIHYADSQLLIALGSTLRCYTLDKKGFPVKNGLWQIEVPQIRRHDIRTNDISRFIIKNDMLVCGNRDGCVAVYKIDKHALKSKPSLLKHIVDCHNSGQSEVSAVEMVANSSRSCLVTGSGNSQKLRLWQFIPGDLEERLLTCETIFEGVKDFTIPQCVGLRCLAVNSTEDKVAIGPNGNCEPILLDVETGNVLFNPQILLNRMKAVRDIQWHNTNTVCYVTHSGLLEAVDTRSNEMVYSTADPFRSTLYCVKTDGQRSILVGSSEYSRCVLFDERKTTQHVQMYFTQKKSSPVYSLAFDSTKLIAAADRSVALLNFNVSAANVPQRNYLQTFEVVQE